MTRNQLSCALDSTEKKPVPKQVSRYVKVNCDEVRRWRKLHGLSQELLAAKSGLALKTVRNLENNPNYECRPVTVDILAKFFDIAPQEILATAPHKTQVQLLTSAQDVIKANIEIAANAKKILACSGSRSRDKQYLQQIEDTIQNNPQLIHYRAMFFPPFKKAFQNHLLKLLEIRNPKDRSLGYKNLHISLYTDLVRQPEYSVCANESTALLVLPSFSGIIGEYNAALLFKDINAVSGIISMIKNLCASGKPMESQESIQALGLVQKGELYD